MYLSKVIFKILCSEFTITFPKTKNPSTEKIINISSNVNMMPLTLEWINQPFEVSSKALLKALIIDFIPLDDDHKAAIIPTESIEVLRLSIMVIITGLTKENISLGRKSR